MSYKNVSQPRLVASLEGEVVGGSYNRKLGSVAMLGHNPSQLAIVGQSGSPSRVLGVTLDEPSDVVLLSRDLAAVRSGAQVWSMVDLAHKPRVDPLTDDVKQLVGPQGDAALALKWDNSGEQLSPGKNEISLRPFGLRGVHRAVDVGENETYAVVDGEGDGELRIHPGGTPEQGSITKVALPPGAKKLDRVRGAKFLQAVYRRGDGTVCLVKRAGNRLEPKMVKLDAPVTDIAVVDNCLLAITSDGRVVLYDDEAIDKASSSLIEPKSETHLNCRGEPSAMLVAGGHVFVGTSTGEVILSVLVRKQVFY